jgi:hypothetical protein
VISGISRQFHNCREEDSGRMLDPASVECIPG